MSGDRRRLSTSDGVDTANGDNGLIGVVLK